MKRLLRLAHYPRYGPLGLDDPQQLVEVWLRGPGELKNVTRNNVITALRPFTIGVMFGGDDVLPETGKSFQLRMHERAAPERLLGVLHLRLARTIELPEHRFCLFEVDGSENYCVPSPVLRLYYLREEWRAWRRQQKNPYNFQMASGGVPASHVFYICPRPVVWVSVEHQGSSNLFPMDLIGPTDSPWFSMALRTTSPAVRLIQESRGMALAGIPFADREVAYQLGRHHRLANIDWAALPFTTSRSPFLNLRVPSDSLRLREVSVREFHEVGSHMLFITEVKRETTTAGEKNPQLFHTFRSY